MAQDGSRRPALIPEAWLDGVVGPFNGASGGETLDAAESLPDTAAPELSQAEWSAFRRAQVVTGWLQALPRRSAPVELEGRIVAAMHSGFCQDRATSALGELSPLTAPSALDAMVAKAILDTEPQPRRVEAAPPILDRLVEERLLERSVSERSVSEGSVSEGSISKSSASVAKGPEDGLLRQLSQNGPSDTIEPIERRALRGWGLALAGAAAAALIVLGAGRLQSGPDANESVQESAAPSFTIVRITKDNVQASDRAVLGALGIHVPEGNS